ncbi:hypothetical protein RHGRI_026311 [Rhododendron griersonianum]|uniref:Uncharacterized protein n=1 Tax=Rhododendron griersonianum TaxID=479676 RepID=A0AAV6IVQ8_9ERIC|nr:hypothetical protein RHGRI_026311 [Rhododendron griersonianum]
MIFPRTTKAWRKEFFTIGEEFEVWEKKEEDKGPHMQRWKLHPPLANLRTSCLPSAISHEQSVLKFGHLHLPVVQLRSDRLRDGQEVVVKRLSESSKQEKSKTTEHNASSSSFPAVDTPTVNSPTENPAATAKQTSKSHDNNK